MGLVYWCPRLPPLGFTKVFVLMVMSLYLIFCVDDLLFFTNSSRRDALLFKSSLRIFCPAFGMINNRLKSSMPFMSLVPGEVSLHSDNFDFIHMNVALGLKYLSYIINPNDYSIKDRTWMLARL